MTRPMTAPPPPKMAFERVFDRLRAAADEAMADCPELRSVAVVTDWEVGATEFPFGIMIGRGGPVRHPAALQGVTGQTVKMLYHQCQVFTELLASADDLARRLTEEIKARERDIRDREARLAELDAAIVAATKAAAVDRRAPAGHAPPGHGGVAALVGEHPSPNRVGGPEA